MTDEQALEALTEHDAATERAAFEAVIARLSADNRVLNEQVTRLHEQASRHVAERRALDRHQMVREFFVIAGQGADIAERPGVPCARSLKLGLQLVAEEFVELLHAVVLDGDEDEAVRRIRSALSFIFDPSAIPGPCSPLEVDLPAAVDAIVDLMYVLEGSRFDLALTCDPSSRSCTQPT